MSEAVASGLAGVSADDRWRRERRFYSGMALAMAATVLAGFAPTYYLKVGFGTPALSRLLHVHGFLFSAWIVLLVTQTSLVAARRVGLHRQLGTAGAVLAAAMVVAGAAAGIDGGRRGAAPPGIDPLFFMVVPLTSVVVFPALIGAALFLRRNLQAHKRLMLIGTAELLTAAIGRLPGVAIGGPPLFFVLTDLFVVALLVHDRRTLGRFHPATVWGGLFLVASQPLALVIGGTGAWLAFAGWLVR